ncbi:MAG: IPT/TIG domain-containing protein [Candidatus Sulfotelmatobacter sp.]
MTRAAARSSLLCVLVTALATAVSCSCPTAPSVTSISPSSTSAGGSPFVLTINGNNFSSDSVVNFNGSDLTPSLVTRHQVVATIPASDIAQPGTLQVLVLNPPTGGTTSTIGGTGPTTTSSTCGGNDSNAVSFTVSP